MILSNSLPRRTAMILVCAVPIAVSIAASIVVPAVLSGAAPAYAGPPVPAVGAVGPRGGRVVLIRHAEKPDDGRNLSEAGALRARADATVLQGLSLNGRPIRFDRLVATQDSRHSDRPRETLAPLAQALHLPIEQPAADKDVTGLAAWLHALPAGQTVLVAWHHGAMPKLMAALGADPARLLPDGHWPETDFGSAYALSFDAEGRLVSAVPLAVPPP